MNRYSKDRYCRCSMEPSDSGAWVMFDDLEWPTLPPGFEASRNENGSITVTNDLHSIIVESEAASARQAPEEMLHALLAALGA
jgi:hypothetical protein